MSFMVSILTSMKYNGYEFMRFIFIFIFLFLVRNHPSMSWDVMYKYFHNNASSNVVTNLQMLYMYIERNMARIVWMLHS